MDFCIIKLLYFYVDISKNSFTFYPLQDAPEIILILSSCGSYQVKVIPLGDFYMRQHLVHRISLQNLFILKFRLLTKITAFRPHICFWAIQSF